MLLDQLSQLGDNYMFYRKYIITFLITLALFGIAFLLSSNFANQKIDQVRIIQDKISNDILSSETRFMLLASSSCKHFESNEEFETELNNELSDMARRVKFMENQLGYDDSRVLLIKSQYVLLQIKDYILHRQLAERCKDTINTILYFHDLDCTECKEQSIVLDEIHKRYPSIRIYWFDISSETPALSTLVSMFQVNTTPTLVVGDDVFKGFQDIETIESNIKKIFKIELVDPEKES